MNAFIMEVIVPRDNLGPVMEFLLSEKRAQVTAMQLYGQSRNLPIKEIAHRAKRRSPSTKGRIGAKRSAAAEKVYAFLSTREGDTSAGELQKAMNMAKYLYSTAVRDLQDQGKIKRKGHSIAATYRVVK